MKFRGKKIKIISLAFFLCFLLFMMIHVCENQTINALADTETNQEKVDEKLNEIINEQLNALNLKELEKYVSSLTSFENKSLATRLTEYIAGEKIDYAQFGKDIINVLFFKLQEMLPTFLCIITITILSGLINSLRSLSMSSTTSNIINLIAFITALIPLLAVLSECLKGAFHSVNEMQQQMQLIFPLMLTLMAASGGSVSAAIARPSVAFFSSSIVSIITSVVFPLVVMIIAFSIVGNLSKELKISRFTTFFKSINKWILGLSVSVFGLFFTLQGISAATYDGIARRAAKYAIGNGIPIVGGFLSGGFDLAIAGSILIKNSLGSMGIFLMLSVIFEPLILLISSNLLLRMTAAIAQPIGDNQISNFLGETADNLNFCTAGLLFTAFLYFLSIVMMICSSEALL